MQNPVSKLNEYCQQRGLSLPEYLFNGEMAHWACRCNVQIGESGFSAYSPYFTTKKAAKENAAATVLTMVPLENQSVTYTLFDNTIFLVDGDQRADCLKFLATCNFERNTDVKVFISPTTPVIPNYHPNITYIKAKSTNRDSADAEMLIYLGQLFEFFCNIPDTPQFVIVSSDHILVQAAQDYGLTWIPHLAALREFLLTTQDSNKCPNIKDILQPLSTV